MLSNKRFRQKCALLLAGIILLNPIHGMAEEVNGQFGGETQKVSSEVCGSQDATDTIADNAMYVGDVSEGIVKPGVVKPEAVRLCDLGNNGYYIINGVNMVATGDAVIVGEEDGIHIQTVTDEVLLCSDVARNLNYGENKLYYTTASDDGTHIKIMNLISMKVEKTFELSGWDVKQMYLVNNEQLMFLAGGCIFTLDLATEEMEYLDDYSDVFSFIPTGQGVVYAKGSVQDYTLYIDERKVEEHVSDYYMEDDVLVFTVDGEEYRLGYSKYQEIKTLSEDFDIKMAYTTETWFETISEEEFLADLSKVVPVEDEETGVKPLFAPLVDESDVSGSTVALGTDNFHQVYTEEEDTDDSVLIDAKVTKEQKEIAKRARDIYNDTWVTLGKVKCWGKSTEETDVMEPGEKIHGIIYTQAVYNGKFVLSPTGMSWDEYKEERANKDSKLYSTDFDDWSWAYVRQKDGSYAPQYGPKYGCDCSTFASYCWDLEERKPTREIWKEGVQRGETGKFVKIQVGDILNEAGNHVVVITDVKYNQDGNIAHIEVTEQTVPDVRQTVYDDVDDLLSEGGYGSYTLYRSKKVKNTELTIDKKEYTCYAKETFRLSANGVSGGKIAWKSSNSSVAKVDQTGLVTAKKAGTATITVTVTINGESQKAKCKVTVKKKTLKMDSKKTVYLGYPAAIEATATPEDTIIWSSSNQAVATVKGGVVTGVKKGTAKITAKANGVTKTCTVTVKECSVKMKQKTKTVYKGETVQVIAIAKPLEEKVASWSSSNTQVAVVDQLGNVTGIKKGTAVITAKLANGNKATCKVQVKNPAFIMNNKVSVYKGDTKKITATASPTTSIIWKSENPAIATVDGNGQITGVAVGKTRITAVAHGIKRTCTVTVKKPTFTLRPSKLTVYKGYTGKITVTPLPNNVEVEWSCSDEDILQIESDGTVKGKQLGKAVITAKAHGIVKKCTVTVKAPSLKLNNSKMTVYKGENKKIKATSMPANVTVKWSSSDSSVAEVSADGAVTGVNPGTATITAQAHGISRTCVVTVLKPNLIINKTSLSIYKGATGKIVASATPKTTIVWESSNKAVATVDAKGVVTGVKAGKATITATANGIIRECEVTVKNPTLTVESYSYSVRVGQTVKISAYTAPAATINYRSLRTSIATVNSNGRVTGVSTGTATIIVSANECAKYVKITVTP